MDAKIQRLKKTKARGSNRNTANTTGASGAATTNGGSTPSTVKDEQGTLGNAPPSSNHTRPTYDTAEKQQLSRECTCFYCKGLGNLARECTNKPAWVNEAGSGPPVASTSVPLAPFNSSLSSRPAENQNPWAKSRSRDHESHESLLPPLLTDLTWMSLF